MKRCSAHATGMTFESDGEAMDGMENETGVDGEVKENNEEGSDAENGEEDGGAAASDSEKGTGDAGSGGLNAGWSDGWAGEEMSMDSILEKARQMVAEMSKPGAAASAKPTTEKKKTSNDALTGIDDQNGKKRKVSAMNFQHPVFLIFTYEGFSLFWIGILPVC